MNNNLESFFLDKEQSHEKQARGVVNQKLIHITDTTSNGGAGINVGGAVPNLENLKLTNSNQLDVYYYAFANFSFLMEQYNLGDGKMRGFESYNTTNPKLTKCYGNCECVLFPFNIPEKKRKQAWILFVEAKYAMNIFTAKNYPTEAVNQIITTVQYLRRHNVIPNDKNVKAIITLPNITDQTTLFSLFKYNTYVCDEKLFDTRANSCPEELSLEKIKKKYNINIFPCNEAQITSWKRLDFPIQT